MKKKLISILFLVLAAVLFCGSFAFADDTDLSGEALSEEESFSGSGNLRPGATPIPIYPMDMPTPTPIPELTFEYQAFMTTYMGLQFEGPIGWDVTADSGEMYILTESDAEAKEGYNATAQIIITPVNSTLKGSALRTELRDTITTLKASVFKENNFNYAIAERTLLDTAGYYANITGELNDGTYVYSYILMTCIDNKVIRIQLMARTEYRDSYGKIMARMRNTLSWITQ